MAAIEPGNPAIRSTVFSQRKIFLQRINYLYNERKAGQSLQRIQLRRCRGKSGHHRTGYLVLSKGPARVRRCNRKKTAPLTAFGQAEE
jgi:hypothetical protein